MFEFIENYLGASSLMSFSEYLELNKNNNKIIYKNFIDFTNKNKFSKFQKYCMEVLYKIIYESCNEVDIFDAILEQIELSKCVKVKQNNKEEVIPQHYTNLKIEPISFIVDHNLDFCSGNIVKYVSRLNNKDKPIDELKKIFFYFDVLMHQNYYLTKQTFR